MTTLFNDLFAPQVSGFRKGRNCQHVLMNFVDKCKNDLDNKKMYGSLMTDLSKAFDCLPPRLLIHVSKLNAYGVDKTSCTCMLMANYFVNRKQRVKLSDIRSDWMEISKGSPQGSLMGPMAYNDLFYYIMNLCDVL